MVFGIEMIPTLFTGCLIIGIILLPIDYMNAFFRAHKSGAPPTDKMILGYMTLGNVCCAAFQVIWPIFCLVFFHIFEGLTNHPSIVILFATLWLLGGTFVEMAVDWSHHSENHLLKTRWYVLFYIIWPLIYLLRWRLFPEQPIDISVSAFFFVFWFMGMPLIEMIARWLRR